MCWLCILFTGWIQLAITSFPEIGGGVPAEGAIPFAGEVGLCKNAFPETADHPKAARLFFLFCTPELPRKHAPSLQRLPLDQGSTGPRVQE